MRSDNIFQDLCLEVFNNSLQACTYFLPLLVGVRILWANISGSGSAVYGRLIQGVLLFFVLTHGFEYILGLIFEIPSILTPNFAGLQVSFDQSYFAIPNVLRYLGETLLIVIFYLAEYLHLLIMVMLCALAPIFFLLSTVLEIGLGVKLFFGLLLTVSSWPFVWFAFDHIESWLKASGLTGFPQMFMEAFIGILKALGPVGISIAALSSEPGRAFSGGFRAFQTGGLTTLKHFNNNKANIKNVGKTVIQGAKNVSQRLTPISARQINSQKPANSSTSGGRSLKPKRKNNK